MKGPERKLWAFVFSPRGARMGPDLEADFEKTLSLKGDAASGVKRIAVRVCQTMYGLVCREDE